MRASCKFCQWKSEFVTSDEVCPAARQHLIEAHPEQVAKLRKREQEIEDLIAKTERQFGDAYRPY